MGVNTNPHDPAELKAVMAKEEMNWRSTTDQGAIAAKWNSPGTPVYYVLDPAGTIRHKWVGNPGEKALDAALDKLIAEAERAAAKQPK